MNESDVIRLADPAIRAVAVRHRPPPGAGADDIMQEARIVVLRRYRRGAIPLDTDQLRRYAAAITRGVVADMHRKLRPGLRRGAQLDLVPLDTPVESGGGARSDTIAGSRLDTTRLEVDRAVDELPERLRYAVRARQAGLLLGEIGRDLGVTESAVSFMLRKARRRLGVALDWQDAA